MKKYLMLAVLCFCFAGCSFLPRVTFDRAGTAPQSKTKNQKSQSCKGKFTTDGTTVDCERSYQVNERTDNMVERKLTLSEKIGNFISNLAGWGLPIIILALIFVPGLGGWLINRLFSGVGKALDQTVSGIKAYRASQTPLEREKLDAQLSASQDVKSKDIIDDIRNKIA